MSQHQKQEDISEQFFHFSIKQFSAYTCVNSFVFNNLTDSICLMLDISVNLYFKIKKKTKNLFS